MDDKVFRTRPEDLRTLRTLGTFMSLIAILFAITTGLLYWIIRDERKAKATHLNSLKMLLETQQIHLSKMKTKLSGRYWNTFGNKKHRAKQSVNDYLNHIQRYNLSWYKGLNEQGK